MRSTCLTFLFLSVLSAQPREILPKLYYRTFFHQHPALATIRTGEVIATKTIDSSGRDFRGAVAHPDPGNPLTGPFFVEGAEPGDALLIRFRKIRMNRDWGYSGYRLGLVALTPEAIERTYPNHYKPDSVIPGRANIVKWQLDPKRNLVRLNDPKSTRIKLEFPARPMLGCVGVAAAGDWAPTSGPAGPYGGNLDYNEVVEGATVILPVFHPGARLFIGDGHALMGDGEATGNGIETSMDVEFSVTVRKKARLTGPRLENDVAIISIGAQPEFSSALDRGLQMATSDMVDWLTSDYGLEPWAAHLLISFQARYDVVTVAGSVGLRIPKRALAAKP
ncbi:MAG: acetamidase/formamidase family protein [Bryobacteraceae bacterium]